jgi:hypothetical protein
VGDDVPAQVEDRKCEQPFLDQEKAVEHAPGSAVAVGERVDRLELVVGGCHPNEGIGRGLGVQKPLPVREEIPDLSLTLGRRVDDLAGPVVHQRRTRNPPNGHLHSADPRADGFGGPCVQRALVDLSKPLQQGLPISQRLSCRRIRVRV